MKAPGFWHRAGLLSAVLTPVSWLYQIGASFRLAATNTYTASVPVFCVGNLVAGGAGKTPVALALGRALIRRGLKVAFLSRGYGGNETGPLQVLPDRHTARDVGDEPLLLAEAAPTWIARDRAAGARMAAEAGADIILLDDGFQNPALAKTMAMSFRPGHCVSRSPRAWPAPMPSCCWETIPASWKTRSAMYSPFFAVGCSQPAQVRDCGVNGP